MNSVRCFQGPKGDSKRKVQTLNNNLITSKRYEIECQVVLITNRKSTYGLSIDIDIGDLE